MSTYEKTVRDFDNYVRPILGNMALQDITPLVIEKYYRDLQNMDSAVNKIHKTKRKVTTGTIKTINKHLKCRTSGVGSECRHQHKAHVLLEWQ